MVKKLRVLGVCSGNGVCLYPFKLNPNFKLLGNIECRSIFYTKEQKQWKANFGNKPMVKSLKDFKSPKKVDIIIGHPDCGDSSVLRMSRAKKSGNPKENASIKLFVESIKLFSPTYFLLENLPGFLKSYPITELSNHIFQDYHLKAFVVPVSEFGNSQISRVRLVMVGCLKDQGPLNWELGKVGTGLDKVLTSRCGKYSYTPAEYFELGEPEQINLGHIREPLDKLTNLYLPNGVRKISYRQSRDRWMQLGPKAQRWPVGGVMNNQPGVTRNTVGNPPLTVRKQNRQFGTTGLVLSPREMANIQGVPLCFKIFVDLNQRVYWLNKARASVTKCAVYEVGVWFMRCIMEIRSKGVREG